MDRRVGEWPDAAEADVRGGAVGSVGGASGYAVTVAVGGVTEKGSAFHDLGLSGGGAGWVVLQGGSEGGVEPVGAPLPYVAGDGVEAEGVGWKAVDGTGSGEAVLCGVDAGEFALLDVAEVLDSAS